MPQIVHVVARIEEDQAIGGQHIVHRAYGKVTLELDHHDVMNESGFTDRILRRRGIYGID